MHELDPRTLADLLKSGLSADDASVMGIFNVLPDEMTKIIRGAYVPAYGIPYFDLDGNPTGFIRYRTLEPFQPKNAKKAAKYLQPPGSGNHFYMPPCVDWRKISSDTTIPLSLTEGEKKAAIACKLGIPTLGIAGVRNWMSKAEEGHSEAIEDFDLFAWKGREVTIVFDTDA